jgi:hypothetical protein
MGDEKKLKCPHCGSNLIKPVDVKDPEFIYYQCMFCGGHLYVPKKPEPKVWE